MTHSFLFEPGVWTLAGTFWSGDGRAATAEGRVEIVHRDICWLLAGSLKVLSSPPVEFKTAYQIELPGKDATVTKWSSENPAIGKLHGTFAVVGPSILSIYRCEGAGYHGTETLVQLDANHYAASAILLLDDRRLSSWHVTMSRVS